MSKPPKTKHKLLSLQGPTLSNSKKKVLVVAAHPDDEMLGLEGSLIKHRRNGDSVDICLMSNGRLSWIDQRFDTESQLRWTQSVERYVGDTKYDVVYTHWNQDRNKDHRIVSEAVTTALRPWLFGGSILFFETPDGSTGFNPNYFVKLTTEEVDQKLINIAKVYPTELREYPHPRSIVGIRYLARYRGMQAGYEHAEGFEVYRMNGL